MLGLNISGRNVLLATVAHVAVISCMSANAVQAAERTVEFNIPAGNLGSVINSIALSGGARIALPARLTNGRQAGPITGRMTVRQALLTALSGTGLTAVSMAGGYTVQAAQNNAVRVGDADVDVGEVEVTDDRGRDRGFAASNSGSSSRIDAPLQEIPQSITAVTKDVLNKQVITSGYEAATNVSGVTIMPSDGAGSTTYYSVRGVSDSKVLVGGALTQSITIPMADIDRVDVIKGPSSILTGVAVIGGVVNIVTKRPTDQTIREGTAYFGSNGYKTLAVDLGGKAAIDGFTYRFNASGNVANETYGGYLDPHEYLISPSMTWRGEGTTVTAGVRFIDSKFGAAPYTIYTSLSGTPQPYHVDRSTPIGNPNATGTITTVQPMLEVSHTFDAVPLPGPFSTAEFTVNNKTQYTDSHTTLRNIGNVATFDHYLILYPAYNKYQTQGLTQQNDVTIKLDSQYVKQTMRFGFDYTQDNSSVVASLNAPGFKPTVFADITNPPTMVPLGQPVDIPPTTTKGVDVGWSFQDKVDVFDRLHILGAVRTDQYNSNNYTNNQSIGTYQRTSSSAVSYSAGAAFDVLPWFTIYGSDGTGFQPQSVILVGGSVAPPMISTSDEIGVKLALLDKRLNLTGSVYELTQSNSIITTGLGATLGAGFRSKGVEFDLQGLITPNISVIASASYAKFDYSDPTKAASKVLGQPGLTASAYMNYTFTEGPLEGLYLGAGGHGVGRSYLYGYDTDYLEMPGYAVADLYIGFKRAGSEINFKVANVSDLYYVQPASSFSYVPIGQGRTFTLMARQAF